ncbi:Exopolysaccharide synthesis ExoD [Stanieria cyanosphaera PCC 7437]|uniref:Exopolysaccharide synthesis ExoD n=1 Tax=Stanieria cyanosphaera (strain ATCC 29371 / PCC 7437) TaxID=111780 RepID=K9XSM9_STAC7|nr:exopolysaccharide biosynthesis protein [Stanieria cyanosphaera]AFZ35610.1 Exopolysaccharide synthesis ExoD [Stanieria cyanosphaera PCC 7437]
MNLRFSQDIESLLQRLSDQPLTLRQILAETSERGFSLSLGLLALPFLFPMPPGLSTILGLGCLILAVQMAMGRKSPWLPKKIARFEFPRKFSLKLLHNAKRVNKFLGKVVRHRWLSIAESSSVWRINGFCIAWLTILLMLPIPFTNPIPASAILLLAVATLEADGLLIFFGYGLTVLNTLFFGFIGYALWQAPHLLPNLFR